MACFIDTLGAHTFTKQHVARGELPFFFAVCTAAALNVVV